MVNIGEMMNKAIMDGMLQAIIIFMPYIIPFLTTALVVWVIKKIIEKFTYDFSTISGDSRRIAREKARKMGNVVDMISSFKDITESIKMLKENGLWIYGLDMEGASNIYDTKFDGAIGIVVGNEGDGISRLVRENCDFMVKIPMTGKINSLNASVSTAISIYEVVRQKNKNYPFNG